jgi:hypothetical protein
MIGDTQLGERLCPFPQIFARRVRAGHSCLTERLKKRQRVGR